MREAGDGMRETRLISRVPLLASTFQPPASVPPSHSSTSSYPVSSPYHDEALIRRQQGRGPVNQRKSRSADSKVGIFSFFAEQSTERMAQPPPPAARVQLRGRRGQG